MPGTKYEVYVHKGRPIWKIITGILFSHVGLFVLCMGYGALGAYIFILLERPAEEERFQEKLNRTADVDESINYLKTIFYHYATNVDRYNYTRDQYREAVYADLDTLKKFVVNYYHEYNYDMTGRLKLALLFLVTEDYFLLQSHGNTIGISPKLGYLLSPS